MPILVDTMIQGKIGQFPGNVVSGSQEVDLGYENRGLTRTIKKNVEKVGASGSTNYTAIKPKDTLSTLMVSQKNANEATVGLIESGKGNYISSLG